MSSVLIIVVTYNGIEHVRNCFSPLKKMPENMKCIVIDNGSTDGTLEVIKKEFPFIELIETGKNLGFGAANNIGLRKAISEDYNYIYLLNQDAWIQPEDIQKLIELAEKNPDFGIISPLHVYADKKKIDNKFSENLPKELKDDFILSAISVKDLYQIKRRTIQAAHWLLKTEIIKKVGGFSPTFFHCGEDTNLCRRMEFHGFKLGVAPRVIGVHNREGRTNNSTYYLHLSTNEWRHTISDPNLTWIPKRRFVEKIISTLIYYPLGFFPALFKFIWQLPQIRKNKRISIFSPSPFL